MNDLAIKAKTDNLALEKIFSEFTPMCHKYAQKYKRLHFFTYDELLQYGRLNIWDAVKKFDPGKGISFPSFCFMALENRYKSLIRRQYGKKHRALSNTMPIYSSSKDADENEDIYIQLPDSRADIYNLVRRKQNIEEIKKQLDLIPFTDLERECLWLFYFEDMSMKEVRKTLSGYGKKVVDNALQRAKAKLRKNEQLQQIYAEMA